jgi:hypothetical protein
MALIQQPQHPSTLTHFGPARKYYNVPTTAVSPNMTRAQQNVTYSAPREFMGVFVPSTGEWYGAPPEELMDTFQHNNMPDLGARLRDIIFNLRGRPYETKATHGGKPWTMGMTKILPFTDVNGNAGEMKLSVAFCHNKADPTWALEELEKQEYGDYTVDLLYPPPQEIRADLNGCRYKTSTQKRHASAWWRDNSETRCQISSPRCMRKTIG